MSPSNEWLRLAIASTSWFEISQESNYPSDLISGLYMSEDSYRLSFLLKQ